MHCGLHSTIISKIDNVFNLTLTIVFICILLSFSNLMFHTTFQKFHHTTSSTSFHGEVCMLVMNLGPKCHLQNIPKLAKKKTKMIKTNNLNLIDLFWAYNGATTLSLLLYYQSDGMIFCQWHRQGYDRTYSCCVDFVRFDGLVNCQKCYTEFFLQSQQMHIK